MSVLSTEPDCATHRPGAHTYFNPQSCQAISDSGANVILRLPTCEGGYALVCLSPAQSGALVAYLGKLLGSHAHGRDCLGREAVTVFNDDDNVF
jgi:hypothetical protein